MDGVGVVDRLPHPFRPSRHKRLRFAGDFVQGDFFAAIEALQQLTDRNAGVSSGGLTGRAKRGITFVKE